MTISKNLLLVFSGGFGQLVSVLLLPILARMYSPQDFGQLGAVLALVSITSVIIHGRYHMAIPVVKGEAQARTLLHLALASSVLLCLPVAGILWVLFSDSSDSIVLWWLPVAAMFSLSTAALDILAYWRSRFLRFGVSAQNVVARSITTAIAQVGVSPVGSTGLLLGTATGMAFALGLALRDVAAHARGPWRHPSLKRMLVAARRFKTYPLYGVPQGWVAAVSWNALPLLLLRFAGTTVAGQYWVAYRLLAAPLSLVNGAYRQTTLPVLRQTSLQDASLLVRRDTIKLLCLGGAPLFILFLMGESLFALLMGASWQLAGTIAGWMALGILGDLMKIPMLCLMQSLGYQSRILIWEVVLVAARYAFVIPLLMQGQTIMAIAAFSVLGLAGWSIAVLHELRFVTWRITQ